MASKKPSTTPIITPPPTTNAPQARLTPPRAWALAALILALSFTLAETSLVLENPTIDEVLHLPAGLSYWQTGTFRMYPHNPPLVKLVAAIPVLIARPQTTPLYTSRFWREEPPNKAGFGHEFAALNAPQYFELFTSSRLCMPLFGLLGGLAVFAWSRRLYGNLAGLLSLSLWSLCPNILAHERLITTDVAASAFGALATYLFWRSMDRPTWRTVLASGTMLGLAQLSKYSSLLLLLVWPALWWLRWSLLEPRSTRLPAIARGTKNAAISLLCCAAVINLGYRFEGFGRPLGDFPFTCGMLTVERATPALTQPRPETPFGRIREYRVNRFRGTLLGALPVPLPRYYVQGFDDQKLEADGIWKRFLTPPQVGDRMGREGSEIVGYPVYLNGEVRSKSWAAYYAYCLLYKIPEGTIAIVLLALAAIPLWRRDRRAWFDESAVLAVPVVLFSVISFGTNINIGLRYILPAFPYLFVFAGRVAPWVASWRSVSRRRSATALLGLALAWNIASVAMIHPSYLAYFNRIAGGPDHGSDHLIDSNLDWGQDLVGLERWIREHAEGTAVGIAYFGQINPEIFRLRGAPLNWYLPPAPTGSFDRRDLPTTLRADRPGQHLRPGLYAVSASLVRGLEWRVYDPGRWAPYAAARNAFAYFSDLEPIAKIGHSIFVYRLTKADIEQITPKWFGG